MASKKQSETIERISRLVSDQNGVKEIGTVAVMPDYFVDRFIKIESFDALSSQVKIKGVEGGGGSIRGISQHETKGGNAVNVGYSLATLGVNVNLFAIAEGLAAEILRSTMSHFTSVKLEVLNGRCGYTTAFEFVEKDRIVNVMVSDVGDLQSFDGSGISDWKSIEEAKVVAVLNWASNHKGTDLCERVFSRKGGASFFDPADLSSVTSGLPEFKKRILDRGLLDVTSINDNEARTICKTLTNYILPQDYTESELSTAAKKIQDAFGSTVDIHTRKLSLSCQGGDIVFQMPCHRVVQKIVTGAGDVWNSAEILGYLAHLETEDRLAFANAAAGLYVSRDSALAPTFPEVMSFMKDGPLN